MILRDQHIATGSEPRILKDVVGQKPEYGERSTEGERKFCGTVRQGRIDEGTHENTRMLMNDD